MANYINGNFEMFIRYLPEYVTSKTLIYKDKMSFFTTHVPLPRVHAAFTL